jgi:hypothetical protein
VENFCVVPTVMFPAAQEKGSQRNSRIEGYRASSGNGLCTRLGRCLGDVSPWTWPTSVPT